jgi:hypothetical protein
MWAFCRFSKLISRTVILGHAELQVDLPSLYQQPSAPVDSAAGSRDAGRGRQPLRNALRRSSRVAPMLVDKKPAS